MKKTILSCAVMIGMAVLPAFTEVQSSITGRIKPDDGAEAVWAINGKDSLRQPVTGGGFSIDVKPGIYKLIVDAKEPYKDVYMENLEVKQGLPLDVGDIYLQR